MEARAHSIRISEEPQELGHEVIVANLAERRISRRGGGSKEGIIAGRASLRLASLSQLQASS